MSSDTQTTKDERLLTYLLRLGGVATLMALPTVFLPVSWMARSHEAIGLGEFPTSTIVDYLSRSLSAFYAIHGGLLLALSRDVRRFSPIIVYVGVSTALLGLLLLGIDLHAGMPSWWTWGEGPAVTVVGVVLTALARRVNSSTA